MSKKPRHYRNETPSEAALDYYQAAPKHFPRARTTSIGQPDTEMEALMTAEPHHEPETSRTETIAMRELVGAVIDMLPDLERHVVELIYIEGLSLRDAADQMIRSKTTVQRIRDNALEIMGDLLANDPEVQRKLNL